MGYTTEFEGRVYVELKDAETAERVEELINGLAGTRRVKRDLTKVPQHLLSKRVDEYGEEGGFFYPTEDWPWWEFMGQGTDDPSVIDYNTPPSTQPSLWLQWIAVRSNAKPSMIKIVWDEGEKFYCYTEWMQYIFDRIIKDDLIKASGIISWQGEISADYGILSVTDNQIFELREARYCHDSPLIIHRVKKIADEMQKEFLNG